MKKVVVLLIALMLFMTLTASAETWADTYARANAAHEAGQLEEARQLYVSIPEYKDSKIRIRQITAELLFAKGEYAQAWDIFSVLEDGYNSKAADYESMYASAVQKRSDAEYTEAETIFTSLGAYRDSAMQARDTVLRAKADELLDAGYYETAIDLYDFLGDTEMVSECSYRHAASLGENSEYIAAADEYASLKDYKDSRDMRYAVGIAALKAGMVEEAWTILDALRGYKDPTEDLYQAAVAAGSRNELSVAVPIYQKLGTYKDCAMRIAMVGYQYGSQLYDEGEYLQAGNVFNFLGKLSDAEARAKTSWYAAANAKFDEGEYAEAINLYELVPGYENSNARALASQGFISMQNGQYDYALSIFSMLGNFEDSETQVNECRYQMALAQMNSAQYLTAASAFDGISSYKDSATLSMECRYIQAGLNQKQGHYDDANALFDALAVENYKDSTSLAQQCHYLRAEEYLTFGATLKAYEEYVKAAPYEDADNKRGMTASTLALEATQKGDYQGAIGWYVKAGDYPGAKEAIEFIGEYYLMTAQYDQAYDAFMLVPELDAAKTKLTELGIIFKNSGNFTQAIECFKASGYTGEEYVAAVAAAREAKLKKTVGSYVTFGTYPQTSAGNDQTAIEWLVLDYDAKNNRALLISRYGLDAKPYNEKYVDITWEKCTLRIWLNGTFLNKAFTTQEQAGIVLTSVDNSKSQGYSNWSTNGGNNTQDKIFLLSYAEANKYFGVTYYNNSNNTKSRIEPTAYAIKQGAYTSNRYKTSEGAAAGWWWLRSPGSVKSNAASVRDDGSLGSSTVSLDSGCVRPALWINLESDIF